MREPLTTELTLAVLRDLQSAFPGAKMTDEQLVRRADVYRDGLGGLSGTALRWAAKTAIQEDEYFPKVARLRELATRWTIGNAAAVVGPRDDSRTCRACHQPFQSEKRFRPKTTKSDGYGYPLTSPDGGWLMLEMFTRDVCRCHPRCDYWPDITAPSSEPAMRLMTPNGGANVPPYTLMRARMANGNVGAIQPSAETRGAA